MPIGESHHRNAFSLYYDDEVVVRNITISPNETIQLRVDEESLGLRKGLHIFNDSSAFLFISSTQGFTVGGNMGNYEWIWPGEVIELKLNPEEEVSVYATTDPNITTDVSFRIVELR